MTDLLGAPELVEVEPPSRTCTYAGCDKPAVVIYGPKTKAPNRCVEHGPPQKGSPESKAVFGAGVPTSGPKPRKGSLEQRLAGTIGLAGTMAYAFNQRDGEIILSRAEALATALDHLAAENPAIKRALEAAMSGGAWGEVVLVVMPMVVAIGANHGLIPERYAILGSIGE